MLKQIPKFTVVVPTRERPLTLQACLKSLVAQEFERLEILVSDNLSQDDTRDVVESFRDPRIKYVNTGRRLSMSDNWEFALGHVPEGWVTFLGDDDAMLPGAISRVAQVVDEYPCEALNSIHARYRWPGAAEGLGANLSVPVGDQVGYRDARTALKAALAGHLPYWRLPWLYHGGFATVEAINRARHSSGTFFMSQIPDLYSAVALSSVVDRYVRLDAPLVLGGTSKHSTGVAMLSSKGDRAPAAKFFSEPNRTFHSRLIYGPSIQLLLYECYLQCEFLHHDFLRLELPEQLRLAWIGSSGDQRAEVDSLCHRIAQLNGVSFSADGAEFQFQRLKFHAYRLAAHVSRLTARVAISGERAGKTACEAAFAAEKIWSAHRARSRWAFAVSVLWGWIGRRARKLWVRDPSRATN